MNHDEIRWTRYRMLCDMTWRDATRPCLHLLVTCWSSNNILPKLIMLLGYFPCSLTKFFHLFAGPQRITKGCPKSYERPIVPGMFQSDGKLMMVQAQTNCILPLPNQGRNAWIMDQNLSETSVFFIFAFQNSKMHSSGDFHKETSL